VAGHRPITLRRQTPPSLYRTSRKRPSTAEFSTFVAASGTNVDAFIGDYVEAAN